MAQAATLESVIDSSFHARPSRAPDHEAESAALVWLVEEMARAPRQIFARLTDAVLRLCRAQSAGISLLSDDEGRFVWPAVAGAWSAYVGGGTPREFGPCGTVLDRDRSLLFVRPQRHFTYLVDASPPIEQALLAPFHIDGLAKGTIWAIVHDQHRFDPEDERLLNSLSRFTSAAYRTLAEIGALVAPAPEAAGRGARHA